MLICKDLIMMIINIPELNNLSPANISWRELSTSFLKLFENILNISMIIEKLNPKTNSHIYYP
jgi:hypothetical protein